MPAHPSASVYHRCDSAAHSPALALYLVDAVTGAQVTGPVAWAPFFEALCRLCEQVGIVVECESVEDESVALFWQPPECKCEKELFTGGFQASTA